MNTIGSHPGAILFRLSIMIILIAIMMVVFFRYLDGTEKKLETASILQTKRIIDSSLAVVFSSYAVKNRLSEVSQLDGGNPFLFLKEYQVLPAAYNGEIDHDLNAELTSGWYYLRHRGLVAYKPFYLDSDSYFAVRLSYEDVNQSGRYEHRVDRFKNLQFARVAEIGN